MALAFVAFATMAPWGVGRVRVTVYRGDNPSAPVSGIMLRIEGTMMGAMTNDRGVATFTLWGPQVVRVKATSPGCTSALRVPVVPAETMQLSMWLCSDRVTIAGEPDEPIAAVVDARDASDVCYEDRVSWGIGSAHTVGNVLPLATPLPACPGTAAIMTWRHAVRYEKTASVFPWTSPPGDNFAVTLPSGRLRVALNIWNATGLSGTALEDLRALIRDHLKNAFKVFNTNGAGIEFVDDDGGATEPVIHDATAAQRTKIGDWCTQIPSLVPDATILDPKRINVYYVPGINGGGTHAGYTCIEFLGSNVVFIDYDENKTYTLAHELGHALGLQKPDWGHSTEYAGFYERGTTRHNLMDVPYADPPYLSFGQTLRINVWDSAWVNTAPTGGISTRQRQTSITALSPTACRCPEAESRPDCPPLTTDKGRTGTLTDAPPNPRACEIDIDPAPGDLVTCGTDLEIKSWFYRNGAPAYGGSKWYSSDPSKISVTGLLLGLTPGAAAQLHAIANGPSTIYAFVGGAMTSKVFTARGC